MNGVAVVIDGAVENTPEGGWSSSGLAVELDGGRAELSGALFPSQDVKFALTDFDLSTAAKLVPKIGEYGVKGGSRARARPRSPAANSSPRARERLTRPSSAACR